MVCRIKNRHTFKSLPILNSAYFTECRFVIRHITQTDTETETEANFTHVRGSKKFGCHASLQESARIIPEMNLRNSLHTGDETGKWGIHPALEIQGRRHQKSRTGLSMTSEKGLMPYKNFLKQECIPEDVYRLLFTIPGVFLTETRWIETTLGQRPPGQRPPGQRPPSPPAPVNRMTHASKNITLSQSSFCGL